MPWKDGPPKIPCPQCGEPMYRRGKMCRTCYANRAPKRICVDCGGPVALNRKGVLRCRACWMKDHMSHTSRPACLDCGKPISWSVGQRGKRAKAARCMECMLKRRRANRVVVEIARQHAARGNPDGKSARIKRWTGQRLRALLGPLPCALCGYSRLRSRIHRLIPEKGYVLGNVTQVCSRCHDEIHAGITDCPPATLLHEDGSLQALLPLI